MVSALRGTREQALMATKMLEYPQKLERCVTQFVCDHGHFGTGRGLRSRLITDDNVWTVHRSASP